MKSILNRTKNYFRCIGTVNEMNLKREDTEIMLKDEKGNDDHKESCERIYGTFTVRTDNGIITFNTYFTSLNQNPNKDGKHESKQWQMAEKMMDWIPEINGNGEAATLVNVEGRLDVNDYVGNDGEVKTGTRFTVSKASTKVNPDDPKGCSWSGNMFIKSIRHETRGTDGEETGRLIVDLYGANSKGECLPFKAIVEKDLAEDFEEIYSVNETVPMDIDVIARHVGETNNTSKKKAFGRGGSVAVNSGFDVTEMVIVGADEAIEEPEEEDGDGNVIENGYIDPDAMKAAIKERNKKLEEMKANGGTSTVTKKSGSIKEAKKKMGASGKRVEENPFDDEDDPF